MSFASLGLAEPITRGVRAAGYTQPTPIQLQAIPLILPGHDLIAAAQTGSGKTAAFLLPILARLLHGTRALRALVLVPTRELAAQVEDNARAYARFADVRVGAAFGGVPIGPQERMLRNEGLDLLVATPGRLLDLHGRQSLALDDIEVLVLDEADRMVDMGFAPDLRRILRLLPTDRQTLMFSATMPKELNRVATEALQSPRRVDLAPPSKPAPTIEQAFYPVPRHLKTELLDLLLRRTDRDGTIVFTRTKHGAERLGRQLHTRGHDVAILHGDRSQGQRERALEGFRRGKTEILVATDIASRGIDVDDVTHVINFDVPRAPEDYVHRIGRTGRMDAVGDALTLVCPEDREFADAIERFLGREIEQVKLTGFDYGRRAEPKSDAGAPPRGRGRSRSGAEPAVVRVVRRWGHDAAPKPHAGHAAATKSHAGHAAATKPHAGHAAATKPHAGHAAPHAKPHAKPHATPHTAGRPHAAGPAANASHSAPEHGRRRKIGGTDRRSRRKM